MPKNNIALKVRLFADGGSRGNPGPAGVGAVLFDENGEIVEEVSKYIGTATNNVAEYLAVIYGLQEAVFRGVKEIVINVDSQLVARQLKGEYRVKDQNLRKFFDIASNLLRGFDNIEIREIPREENGDADALVNKAIDLQALL
ncbi:MAG: ribonuclease HI family protein [Candidatus Tantalella remota]|nr:ribonuclease HI family protein [Candidatus Tantalella remota]